MPGGPSYARRGAVKTRMLMNNLKPTAQETLSERETVDFNRWEDDGGQEAPTYAAPTASHHQASSGRTQRPLELDALVGCARQPDREITSCA